MKLMFDHIHIRCEDLEASLTFWVDVLGAELIRRYESRGMEIARLDIGGAPVALSPKREDVDVRDQGGAHWGLYQLGFRVDDLGRAVAEIEGKGGVFTGPVVEVSPRVRAAFLLGPDGVEIELMEMKS